MLILTAAELQIWQYGNLVYNYTDNHLTTINYGEVPFTYNANGNLAQDSYAGERYF